MSNLTPTQKDELIQQYVELCVDSMDHKDMYQFVYNQLVHELGEIESREELCDDIKSVSYTHLTLPTKA